MRSVTILAAAIAGCASILWFGPMVAGSILRRLGDAAFTSDAAIETVYSGIIFGALGLLAVAGGAWCRVKPLRFGDEPILMFAAGATAGAAGVLTAIALAGIAGALNNGAAPSGDALFLLWGSALTLFAAAAEEIFFRGWLQPTLARTLGVPLAITSSALAFAALHVMGGARSPLTLINLFLGGLLFGLLAARGEGMAGAIGAHFAWNWIERIGLGLDPNPGAGSFGALLDLDLGGRPIWGGSDEGLNGGLGMTIALFALLVPAVIFARDRLKRGTATAPADLRTG
jgi:membrane protease YdiL (CAAX protease family)